MTASPAALHAADAPPRPGSRKVLDAWRGIGWGHVVAAFLFGCAYFVYDTGSNLQLMVQNPDFSQRPALLAISFVRDQLAALALLACVAVAEHVAGARTRQATYLAAIVVSAAIAGPLKMVPRAATFALAAPGADLEDRALSLLDALCGGFFQWLVLGGAATFVYVDRRRAQTARARLHAAELERTEAARRTLESRLQAMQARVEPQFLFNTLAQVHALYRDDAVRGERMLDELIAYLRAAMPKMRDTSSTLGQEIELARAYLAIVEVRLGDRVGHSIEAPVALGDARMPPMMLLPLVDRAIVRLTTSQAAGVVAIRATRVEAKLRIEVAASGGSFSARTEDEAVAGLRERLATLYGSAASIEVRRAGEHAMHAVVIEFPLEAPPRPMGGADSLDPESISANDSPRGGAAR